ncbi:PREDICTED: alpha carbonic anhydrase 7-like [Fragaria vesca subsp. vesca]|uniref:alpha carbonic anhydrase 7-like n=1 Tax=Fragaria vesca subsp. vesca TaxID=101020 RepID=UPI0002C30F42|nr:PREDICTED: alpha carbonic anhydrase 7-like [Fragaria vesca subsp. vesca]
MMMNHSKSISTSLFLLLLLLQILHPTPITAQEVEDETEFDYLKDSGKGPEHWGDLREDWAACKNGTMQSPIDLRSEIVQVRPNKGEVKLKYKPSNATIRNRGHDISIQWKLGDAGSVEINGTDYWLIQGHWHSPSEHTINGKRFDLELHMVHLIPDANVENNIAVLAYLYKIGKPDKFLSEVSKDIKSLINVKEERHIGVVDPRNVRKGSANFYKYKGSLTVPPCTEGVTWIVDKELTTVSREQVELLREAVDDSAETNARPLQALNGRKVQYFYGHESHIRD